MKIKLLTADVLPDLEKRINEFCEHERVIDVTMQPPAYHLWIAMVKYQPVVHCDDPVFDEKH